MSKTLTLKGVVVVPKAWCCRRFLRSTPRFLSTANWVLPGEKAKKKKTQTQALRPVQHSRRGGFTLSDGRGMTMAKSETCGALSHEWRSIEVSQEELVLSHTLPTGQTFRWVETSEGTFTGTIGPRAFQLTQLKNGIKYRVIAHEEGMIKSKSESKSKVKSEGTGTGLDLETDDEVKALREYFQLNLKLTDFISHWSKCDERFSAVKDYYPGARLLRQDPVECLFSFVCSSNNNISRIHGMVNTLCRLYGSELVLCQGDADTDVDVDGEHYKEEESKGQSSVSSLPEEIRSQKLYMFPTLEQLSRATEEELRANGFGYRAKFITGSVKELNAKPEGGDQWLRSLRQVPYKEASNALMTLPGIGPKVAACVCLFSLDKYQAIPVDTHVWRLVKTHYRPDLQEKKSLTPRLMEVVENTLIEKFGPHAGWAHNVLFLSELAQLKKRLPEKLQTPTKRKQQKTKSPKKKRKL